jgi:putative SOS response-associated peptidase YedK
MCGRFTLTADLETLQTQFGLTDTGQMSLEPRYNIAPSQPIAVITNQDRHALQFYRWGLIPSWAKEASIGNRMINARVETLHEKPSFRTALQQRRCLIPADGMYEWVTEGRQKTPMHIYKADKAVFAFAGLWEIWRNPEGQPVYSTTIITTAATGFMKTLHHRMPVILPAERYEAWLAEKPPALPELQALLQVDASVDITAHAVSSLVNNPRNDSVECIQPVA